MYFLILSKQDIYLNMPFQTWQIRPTGLNECVFNIIGAITEVDIVVKVYFLNYAELIYSGITLRRTCFKADSFLRQGLFLGTD